MAEIAALGVTYSMAHVTSMYWCLFDLAVCSPLSWNRMRGFA